MPVAKDVHHTVTTTPPRDLVSSAADDTTVVEIVDVEAVANAASAASAASVRETDADAHLIRLCLDLQLDAMLLALGAAAAQRGGDGTPPWGRWVAEDVTMARDLAADVIEGGAALPSTLGSDLDHAVPAAAVDNLAARYESMENLLKDVVRSISPTGSFPHRGRMEEALTRCENRLAELRARRLEETPPRGLALGGTATTTPPPALPGEWLG